MTAWHWGAAPAWARRQVRRAARFPTDFAPVDLPSPGPVGPAPALPPGEGRSALPRPPAVPLQDRPLLPPWAAHPGAAARWAALTFTRAAAYYGLRAPGGLARFMVTALRGAARATVDLWRWAWFHDHDPLIAAAANGGRAKEHADLFRARALGRRRRGQWAAGFAGAVAVVVALAWYGPNPVVRVLAAAGLMGASWAYGRRPAPAPVERPVDPSRGIVSRDKIVDAFESAGLGTVTTIGAPTREGAGAFQRWRAVVELPAGTTTGAALKRRAELASAFRVSTPRLYLDRPGHDAPEGQVVARIMDRDPMTGPPVPSPLLKAKTWDLWQGVPFGVNARGAPVVVPLLWTSVLLGAKPRMGKTYAMRLFVLAAALDPFVSIRLWDGKGAGDYNAFRPVADEWGQGHDQAAAQACLVMLRGVSREVGERSARIAALPAALVPQGKLTPELSRDPARGLPLILVVVDEIQRLLAKGQGTVGEQIREELLGLAQNAPSNGVMLLLACQRPTAEVLGDLRAAMGTRAAFATMTATESNMILGEGHASSGFDSSVFPDNYQGVCILRSGADSDDGNRAPQTVRCHTVEATDLAEPIGRAVASRRAAGTLTTTAPAVDEGSAFLVDALAVFGPGESALGLATIAERLADRLPERYSGMSTERAGQLARAAGVEPKPIRDATSGRTLRGLHLDQMQGRRAA